MLSLETPYASEPSNPVLDEDTEEEATAALLRALARLREPGVRPAAPAEPFFANIGPRYGPILKNAGFYAIAVLRAREDQRSIGEAVAVGQDGDGLALWRLTIDGSERPGLWVVVDREFWPAW
jgi:hypothetical protein